jgi:hypothetical protein
LQSNTADLRWATKAACFAADRPICVTLSGTPRQGLLFCPDLPDQCDFAAPARTVAIFFHHEATESSSDTKPFGKRSSTLNSKADPSSLQQQSNHRKARPLFVSQKPGKDTDMKKTVLALATAATVGMASLAAPSPAEAHWRGGGWGPGLAAGLIGAAVVGGIASSAYAYGPGYGYNGYPGYYGGYAPAYYDGYPAYYGGYTTSYYAPAYYGPRYRRVVRPAYAYYAGPRYHRWHHRGHRW